jgi:hypothetical protein
MEDPGYLPGPVGEARSQSDRPVAGHPAGGHRPEGVYDAEGRIGHPFPLFHWTCSITSVIEQIPLENSKMWNILQDLFDNQPGYRTSPLSFYRQIADYYRYGSAGSPEFETVPMEIVCFLLTVPV